MQEWLVLEAAVFTLSSAPAEIGVSSLSPRDSRMVLANLSSDTSAYDSMTYADECC
jgi:hypothetical protein